MRKLKSQRGQMTIEMILIMIVLLTAARVFSNAAQSSGFMSSLVEGPWTVVQGMIEGGVWKRAKDAKGMHPSLKARHGSDEGTPLPDNR